MIEVLIKTDMVAIPKPLAETRIISTSSLFLLKYCPIIKVAGSLVMPTPTPEANKQKRNISLVHSKGPQDHFLLVVVKGINLERVISHIFKYLYYF